uniref:RNA-directed DNA polymerase n=1 Tax=Strigamia maritima TaxID=126957 RepID=T1IKZ6_STRMM
MSTPEPSGRFGRWAVKIQCGAFKILYRQGSQNKVTDALSRALLLLVLPVTLPVTEIPITDHVEETEITQFWPDWSGHLPNPIRKISEKSEYFCNVGVKFCSDKSYEDVSKQEGGGEVDEPETLHSALTEIVNDIPPTRSEIIEAHDQIQFGRKFETLNGVNGSEEVRQEMDKYHNRVEWKHKIRGYILDVDDQSKLLVFFRPTFEEELNDSGNGFKTVISRSLVKKALFTCQGDPLSGHAGRSKTLDRAKHLYYWPRIDRDVCHYVNSYVHCQTYKPSQQKKCAAPYTLHNMTTPWEVMCTDIMGPKPASRSQYKWILVIIDQCTKFVKLYPLTTVTSSKIVDKVNEVACRFGHPSKIISDNGPQFVSTIYKEFCAKRHKYLSSPSKSYGTCK